MAMSGRSVAFVVDPDAVELTDDLADLLAPR